MIRELHEPSDLRVITDLQRLVWGVPDEEVVHPHLLVAAIHAGGLVAVFEDERGPAGFVFGLAAHLEGRPAHHSHMLGVAPDRRGQGIGETLKWFQRDWCLERGIELVRWTFDPLQAVNAHLNLNKLGAMGVAYLENVYGEIGGPLNEGLPSDRLLIEWRLESDRVRAARAGDLPGEGEERVGIPADATRLLREDPDRARRHRSEVGRRLKRLLDDGYLVTGLSREPSPALVLTREEGRASTRPSSEPA